MLYHTIMHVNYGWHQNLSPIPTYPIPLMWVFPNQKVDKEGTRHLWSNPILPCSIVIPKLKGKDWLLAKAKSKPLASYLTISRMLNLSWRWGWSGRLSHSHKLINTVTTCSTLILSKKWSIKKKKSFHISRMVFKYK